MAKLKYENADGGFELNASHLSVPFVCDAGNLNFLSTHGGHNLETFSVK
jgi:hypothetical protein